MLKITSIHEAILEAKRLVDGKLTEGISADEFVEVGDADGFKVYVAAGKTLGDSGLLFHENSKDVFMWIIEGKMEFEFEDGRKTAVKAGECFVLPKRVKHRCMFNELTIAMEGVYEEGFAREND